MQSVSYRMSLRGSAIRGIALAVFAVSVALVAPLSAQPAAEPPSEAVEPAVEQAVEPVVEPESTPPGEPDAQAAPPPDAPADARQDAQQAAPPETRPAPRVIDVPVDAAPETRVAPEPGADDASRGRVPGSQPELQKEETRVIRLRVGQTRFINAPWAVRRISVSDPSVADVDVTTPQRVQLQGKAPGSTELVMWSGDGAVWQARVDVERNLGPLQDQLGRMFPGAGLDVTQLGNVIVIRGQLARAEHVPQLHRFLELSKVEFLDATTVAGVQQVQLQVKIAEVSRTALRAMGINVFHGGHDFFGGVQIGSSAGPFTSMNVGIPEGSPANGGIPFSALQDVNVPPTATLFGGFPDADLQVFVQALAENQYLRVLAEPTLVALSGQEANFLAGGEFPVPVAQLSGENTEITIEYKEFGVRLSFRPIVLGNGTLNLHVMPEVSQLSDVGAVEILGTRVPSILSRRVETTLELKSGQTFAIAGLINRTDNARASRVPALGDLPILGPLFRSVRYEQNETELLILVTASLVQPGDSELPVPGLLHQEPNDWELFGEGRLASDRSGRVPQAYSDRIKSLGLSKLRGPGGWATYERPSNQLAAEDPDEAAKGAADKQGTEGVWGVSATGRAR